jgi:hypothetical protein
MMDDPYRLISDGPFRLPWQQLLSGELLAIPAAATAAAVILYRQSSLKKPIRGGVASPVAHAFSLVERRKKSV